MARDKRCVFAAGTRARAGPLRHADDGRLEAMKLTDLPPSMRPKKAAPHARSPKEQPVQNASSPFVRICKSAGIGEPFAEYKFDDTRKWLFDWAWPTAKLAIEIQGGIFSGG